MGFKWATDLGAYCLGALTREHLTRAAASRPGQAGLIVAYKKGWRRSGH